MPPDDQVYDDGGSLAVGDAKQSLAQPQAYCCKPQWHGVLDRNPGRPPSRGIGPCHSAPTSHPLATVTVAGTGTETGTSLLAALTPSHLTARGLPCCSSSVLGICKMVQDALPSTNIPAFLFRNQFSSLWCRGGRPRPDRPYMLKHRKHQVECCTLRISQVSSRPPHSLVLDSLSSEAVVGCQTYGDPLYLRVSSLKQPEGNNLFFNRLQRSLLTPTSSTVPQTIGPSGLICQQSLSSW